MGLDEERALIVRMVAEKKISPAEAAELIAALEQTASAGQAEAEAPAAPGAVPPWQEAAQRRQGGWEPHWDDDADDERVAEARRAARESAQEAAREARHAAREAARAAREHMREAAHEARERAHEAGQHFHRHTSHLGQDLSRLGANLAGLVDRIVEKVSGAVGDLDIDPDLVIGPTVDFTDVLEGTFAVDKPTIEIENANGPVELRAHDGTQARLELHYRAKGSDEARAREVVARLVRMHLDDQGVRVVYQPQSGVNILHDLRAHIVLHLPRALAYAVRVKTHNGRIALDGLQVIGSRLETGNGRVEITGVTGDRLDLHTGNGRIEVTAGVASLWADTGNGRVALVPQGEQVTEWNVRTGNGRIELVTSQLPPSASIEVRGRTGMGHVELIAPGFTVTDSDGHHQRRLRGVRPGTGARPVQIDLNTGIGSVSSV
jgi:hypothetical protein